MRLILRVLLNGLVIWVASLVLPGVHLETASGEIGATIVTILVVAVIFGILNAIVKPLLEFFSIPITCLTLGLFQLVTNALVLLLTAWVAGLLGVGFAIDGFWWAVLAGIVVGLLNAILEPLLERDPETRD